MVAELVTDLLAAGVRLSVRGGRLVCRAPEGVLTPELRRRVEANKAALLDLLGEVEEEPGARGAIPTSDEMGPWPASVAQERFWLLEQLRPGQGVYNLPGAFSLEGPLDADALERALRTFVARHRILSARLDRSVEGGRLVPMPPRPFRLRRVSLAGVPVPAREDALRRLLEDWAEEPLSLEDGDAFRARLVEVDRERHALFVLSHASVWDGWCFDVMLGELHSLYEAEVRVPGSGALPPLPLQYGDYARWQRRLLAEGAFDRPLAHWRTELAPPLPLVSLPTDFPRREATFAGDRLNFRYDQELLRGLTRVAHAEGATVFMVLLAAFAAVLYRHTRRDQLVILTPTRGRDRPELEGLVGCFSSMMALRLGVPGAGTFRDLLRHVRVRCLSAYANAEVPFEVVARSVNAEAGRDLDALFRVTFTYQNTAGRPRHIGGLPVRSIARGHRRSYAEVGLWVREHSTWLDGALDYRVDLFRRETMERLLEHFGSVLRSVASNPDTPLAELLTEVGGAGVAEQDEPGPPHLSVRAAVAAWAERDPDRIALEAEGRAWTYADLAARSSEPAGRAMDDDAVASTAERVAELLDVTADDTVLVRRPWSDPAALLESAVALVRGARVRVVSRGADDDEWDLADALEGAGVTVLPIPTHLYGRLLATDWRGDPRLRVLCEGGPPSPAVAEALVEGTAGAWWVDDCGGPHPWALCGNVATPSREGAVARPLDPVTARVVDDAGRPLVSGVPGELVIETPGAGSPFATGELVRALGDGRLLRLGRLDGRVVLNGELVDPEQVERVLARSPGLREAAARVGTSREGETVLVAYVVPEAGAEPPGAAELRARVGQALGDAYVPRWILEVDAIPRTSDGSPDGGALPDPLGLPSTREGRREPHTEEERAVASVWRELLGIDRVGAGDNFFELGGTSLMLMRAVGLMEERTGGKVDPRILFFLPLEGVARALTGTGVETEAHV